MAKLSHAESRRMYSWWWDSHISPKNSRWLQENLTDMDVKVKSMIKLIEEDADSFARRAEMYYKKRPELMKLVEEFYRAYRALAERYDQATGALRQAHKTMTEAFPNQLSLALNEDDELASFANENGPQTPGDIEDRKGLKHLNNGSFGSAIRGLNFDEEKERSAEKLEKEIQTLKEALEKFEAEKEASIAQYKQNLEKLSSREKEFSNVKEDNCKSLVERTNKAEKNAFELNERAQKAETEKAIFLNRYRESSEKILDLEKKLLIAEEESEKHKKQAEEVEKEALTLKEALADLNVEKEATDCRYKQCLDINSSLEKKISCAEEEAQKLITELEKLKSVEEKCLILERSNQSLHSELESLKLKMGAQSIELSNKQLEFGKLLGCAQEERMRFLEAETAFQTLQLLHSQTEVELRSLALELQNKSQLLSNMETHNQSLLDEVSKIKNENESLNELNLASSESIKGMQNEISSLRESQRKLEEEVNLRVDQRNALQQEIYCLKEEINEFNIKYQTILDEIEAVGFNPESFQSSVKNLQDENSNLKENQGKEMEKKLALLEKVDILEKSVSDAKDEIEGLKMRLGNSEEEKSVLADEKVRLLSEVENTRQRLEDLEKIYRELEQKYSVLEKEKESTIHEVEKLRSQVNESEVKEGKHVVELENLHGKVLDMQKTSVILQEENLKLIDEKISLVKDFILGETESLSNLSLIFKNIINEKSAELEGLRLTVDKLENKITVMGGELEEAQLENMDLKESLKKSEDNLSAITLDIVQLNCEIENGKDLLFRKETEISDMEKEKSELKRIYDDIKLLFDEENSEHTNEIALWESEATKLFSELHLSSTFRALLEEKLDQLSEELKALEEETSSEDNDIELLKQGISTLEGENGLFRAQLAAYVPAIDSLKDCISSLENNTFLHIQLRNSKDEKVKDVDIESNHQVENHEELCAAQEEMKQIHEMRELEARVKAIEETVIETNNRLDASTRQLEELRSKGVSNQENVKTVSVNSEQDNGLMTKDIMLDQISECTSTDSKRIKALNIDDLDEKKRIPPRITKGLDFDSRAVVEKEFSEDKLTISMSFSRSNEEANKNKILERLNSDVQKLTNLQITVQDLKRKAGMSGKKEENNFGESDSIVGQLKKAEDNIVKLFDLHGNLLKSVHNFDDVKSVEESEENRKVRKRFSEQARKVSEKIGQLQLDVQKLQLVLLKLHDEYAKEKSKENSEIAKGKRTMLRDYLGLRSSKGGKKRTFCACVYPPTSEE